MFAETQLVEDRDRVGVENLPRCSSGLDGEQDRDQPAHDMRVAVALEIQHGLFAAAVDVARQPDLAGAALNLVPGGMLGVGHRGQRAAKFDHIAIAVVPLIEQFEIVPDVVDGHGGPHTRIKGLIRPLYEIAGHR